MRPLQAWGYLFMCVGMFAFLLSMRGIKDPTQVRLNDRKLTPEQIVMALLGTFGLVFVGLWMVLYPELPSPLTARGEARISRPVNLRLVPESPRTDEDGQEYPSVTVVAYTSEVGQTDGTPCIAADGTDICRRFAAGEALCASNDHPFGTMLALWRPGDQSFLRTCVVADRMNWRYTGLGFIDIYMGYDTPAAIEFGRQSAYITVL